MNSASSKTLLMLVLACPAIQLGCARSTTRSHGNAPVSSAHHILSAQDAAELAARLANEQCKRQFGRQPFSPGQHSAIIENGLYHWGQLDVGGAAGFSAVVTFRPDATEPHVEVYFSSDTMVVR
jgi:hypothetical protein